MMPPEKLFESLVKLVIEFEQAFPEQPQYDPPEHERVRYIHALRAMYDFLRANNAPLHFTRPLYRLAIKLSDLNDGKVDPLLTPTPTDDKKEANPGKVTTAWIGHANAALGMVALMAAGGSQTEAARSAMRIIGAEESKLVSWCDEFRKPANNRRVWSSKACVIFDSGWQWIEMAANDSAACRRLAKHFFNRAATELRKQAYRFPRILSVAIPEPELPASTAIRTYCKQHSKAANAVQPERRIALRPSWSRRNDLPSDVD